MTLTSGTQLGSYVILTPLGSGGMGEVYKARDSRLNRLVAIKILPKDFAENKLFVARFDGEAAALEESPRSATSVAPATMLINRR